ncbi:MAG: Fic family protein [Tissierellia bacterium]|nr:Fic family protein [Tissierellia bacterium]
MKLKKEFYKLSKDAFEDLLTSIKNSKETIFFLEKTNKPYFYSFSRDTINILNDLQQKQNELDDALNSFSNFARKQIIQSYFIEEVESTNEIENIYSTKHDIFAVMNRVQGIKDKKIISIVNSYNLLLKSDLKKIKDFDDLDNIYSLLIKDSLKKDDLPDGKHFRKGPVYITDGFRNVHNGIEGEELINESMSEFIELFNSSLGLYERMIIGHFLFETIHPYYDGNGRMGRFLFSYGIYHATGSIFSFKIARAFSRKKKAYYKAFKEAGHGREFGSINGFVEDIGRLLIKEIDISLKDIDFKKNKILEYRRSYGFTKSEEFVFNLLSEASILSNFGLMNSEIQKETSLSQSIISKSIKKFKDMDLVETTKIGYYSYHRLK